MTATISIQSNFPLLRHNTFGIDASAQAYVQVDSIETLQAIKRETALAGLPRLVLGGGSNILLTGDFPGLVLQMCSRGIAVVAEDEDAVYVRAAAGEAWHQLVEWTLMQGFGGLENLSLIPGSVGAAPIQNIGAYGAELKDCFHSLTAFDFNSGQAFTLNKAECQFGYRDSIFKHSLRESAVILDVTLALPKRWQPNLAYAELAQALQDRAMPTAHDISDAVIAIRRRKLPDPAVIGNAGSFFKNPVIGKDQQTALLARFPQLVSHAQANGSFKLAAGWLIDQCGWKGKSSGRAGVYPSQALVLVNLGGASGAEVQQLSAAIQADVLARFGVMLEPEPVFI
jgi:UDP-N-acetylmuramate dehydrogenase